MKCLLRKLHHLAHALQVRAFLHLEAKRAREKQYPLPRHLGRKIWRRPQLYGDRIPLMRFLDPREQNLMIDVGGNTGYWAKRFLDMYPKTDIIAFEPVTESYEQYKKRFADRASVTCHNVALSSEEGKTKIHLAENSTFATLEGYADTQEGREIAMTGRDQEVDLRRLDSYSIDRERYHRVFLKIDVQGHEVDVFMGGGQTLDKVDILLVECSFAEEYANKPPSFIKLAQICHGHGLYPIIFCEHGRELSPYAWERDVIFVREPLLAEIWGW